jgi:hypothetical protein
MTLASAIDSSSIRRVAGPAFGDLDHLDGADADAAAGLRGALAIAFAELVLGPALAPADGRDDDAHARRLEQETPFGNDRAPATMRQLARG